MGCVREEVFIRTGTPIQWYAMVHRKAGNKKRRLELGLTHAFFAHWGKRQPCVLLVVPWQNVQPCWNKLAYLGEQVPDQLVLSGVVLALNQSID